MRTPTNSEVLWAKIHLGEGRMFAATEVFWTHPELGLLLPRFLVQAHCLMRSGLTMMAVARERALALGESRGEGDASQTVAAKLAAYLATHLEEEKDHDAWLLDDLATLGIDEREVLTVRPCDALVALVGAQYFWMMHVHPVAILGYLILMEGYPPRAEQLEEIRLRSGAPATAFRCMKAHAEDDPAHLAELNRTLDEMELTGAEQQAVAMCAFAAIEGLAAMFEELLERHAARQAGTRKAQNDLEEPQSLRLSHA